MIVCHSFPNLYLYGDARRADKGQQIAVLFCRFLLKVNSLMLT